MRWARLLSLLAVLALDFATLDAPPILAGSRHVEVDDEEESAPSRPFRLRRAAPPATATLPAHRYVAPAAAQRRSERVARMVRKNDPPPWVGPIAQAHLVSVGSSPPPEDH